MLTIEDLMTERVVTVKADTPLTEAVNILTKNNFSGLPVVDADNKLVGLLTERDMISSESYVHLKTLLKLLNEIGFYKKDTTPIREDLNKLLSLKVSDLMNRNPKTMRPQASPEEAASMLADPKVNPIPIVNENNVLLGILSLSDLTKLYGVSLRSNFSARQVDQKIDAFVSNFEKEFLFVSKFHTEVWLAVSLGFAVIGFLIAMFFILRISD